MPGLTRSRLPRALAIVAGAADGILAGASLDQSIKQLPARRQVGVVAYSAYSQAADLGPGVYWYGGLGVGSAALTIAAAVAACIDEWQARRSRWLYLAAALALLHSLVTLKAAPTLIGQRHVQHDEIALRRVFDRFERWQKMRAGLQVLTFASVLRALTLGEPGRLTVHNRIVPR